MLSSLLFSSSSASSASPPPPYDPTTPTTTASQIAGCISILCWLSVFTPQLWQNYARKSTDGLSVSFIVVWLFGDVCSFAGAWMQRLLPTMIGLSVYYAVVELFLLYQVWLYRTPPPSPDAAGTPSEESPLLVSSPTSASSSPTAKATATTTRLCFVAASLLVWNMSTSSSGMGVSSSVNDQRAWSSASTSALSANDERSAALVANVLGYVSAVAYVGARFPQIYLNAVRRSCAGLSLYMFVFTGLGNASYIASIFLQSTSRAYIMTNLPWILGSGLTLLCDLVILAQARMYRRRRGSGVGAGHVVEYA
ncbi:hypothetical protein HDU89_006740 [Geranomyces variabilis]|nr:hypothetical protein HDU89_006740 [Geranomyces variabilis]